MGTAGIAVTLYAVGVATTAGTSVEVGNVGVAGITGIAVALDGVEVAETDRVGVSDTTGVFGVVSAQAEHCDHQHRKQENGAHRTARLFS